MTKRFPMDEISWVAVLGAASHVVLWCFTTGDQMSAVCAHRKTFTGFVF